MAVPSEPDPFLEEADRGADPRHPIREWLADVRHRVQARAPWAIVLYRVLVGIIGFTIVTVGVLMIPLPGPGWLVVFLGLAVLGTEFHFARRLTGWLRKQLAKFWTWWRERKARRATA